MLLLLACAQKEEVACGPGTHEEDGLCLSDDADADTDTDTDSDTDADTDSDTDADTDADTDTDTDTDTDADTDVVAARWAGDYRLPSDGFTLGGRRMDDQSGYSMDAGADLDGDGAGDVVVGALLADPDGEDCGAVYVYPGPVTADGLLGDGGATLEGDTADAMLGMTVASGDLDGDGQADLAASATGAYLDSYPQRPGEIYVLAGPVSGETSVADAMLWEGGGANDLAGGGLSVLPDQDGDGADELVVGVPRDESNGYNSGAVYVLSGATTGSGELESAGIRIFGTASATLGAGAQGAGDLNGDGTEDLLVGAGGWQSGALRSAVLVFYGPLGSGFSSDADAAIAGTEVDLGIYAQGHAGVGDVDGDGLVDVAVGDGTYAIGGVQTVGAAWIIRSTDLSTSTSVLFALATIEGTGSGGTMGRAVAGGDLDADGRGDILVSAPERSDYAYSGGAAFLFYGGLSGTYDANDADAAFYSDNFALLGWRSSIADVTGDGVIDLLFGAYFATGDADYSGAVYVVPGVAG